MEPTSPLPETGSTAGAEMPALAGGPALTDPAADAGTRRRNATVALAAVVAVIVVWLAIDDPGAIPGSLFTVAMLYLTGRGLAFRQKVAAADATEPPHPLAQVTTATSLRYLARPYQYVRDQIKDALGTEGELPDPEATALGHARLLEAAARIRLRTRVVAGGLFAGYIAWMLITAASGFVGLLGALAQLAVAAVIPAAAYVRTVTDDGGYEPLEKAREIVADPAARMAALETTMAKLVADEKRKEQRREAARYAAAPQQAVAGLARDAVRDVTGQTQRPAGQPGDVRARQIDARIVEVTAELEQAHARLADPRSVAHTPDPVAARFRIEREISDLEADLAWLTAEQARYQA